MPVSHLLRPAQLDALRKTVDMLRPTFQLPSAGSAAPFFGAYVEQTNREHVYQVLPPARTGLRLQDLVALFERDGRAGGHLPSVGNAAGMSRDARSGRFCLFARALSGDVTGFIDFTLTLEPFEATQGRADHALTFEKAHSVFLDLRIERLQVLRQWRGMGAATVLLDVACDMLRRMAGDCAEQSLQACRAIGVPLVMQPRVFYPCVEAHAAAVPLTNRLAGLAAAAAETFQTLDGDSSTCAQAVMLRPVLGEAPRLPW